MNSPGQAGSAALWFRQVRAVIALEWQRYFIGRRAIPLYLLAAMPVTVMAIRYLLPLSPEDHGEISEGSKLFSQLFQGMTLRLVVFFGCMVIFTNLFRAEIASRSLHYYFLVPIRREVLTVGKYLAGLISAIVIFSTSTAISYVLAILAHDGEAVSRWFAGAGSGHLVSYVGITVLGCLGYGAVFLGLGILFKNPIVPAVLLYGLEWINFLLPAILKKISVVHYLHSLIPVPVAQGPFAIIAEPTPAWLAVIGLLLFTAIVLTAASVVVKRMEIKYTTE